MAIIDNRVTEEGDVLIIKPEVPIIGILSLLNFVDTTQNESPSDYFLKEFRYSENGGIIFSDWIELTNLNISNIVITKYNQFIIEYRYTRVGDAPEVELEFDDILVSGTFEDLPYPIYNTTFFKDFFEVNDINVFGWALNVLEKLYLKGILPEYIVRGENLNNNLEDEDFIVFWNAITHYFAILVYYARQFKDISQIPSLLEQFLLNRGIELGNATAEDSIYIFNNLIDQFRLRGTSSIINKKSDGFTIDGEFLRLIWFNAPEEFIFALLRSDEVGWCISKSSPMWNGTENMINLIKGYEFTKEVIDLTKYPLINSGLISISGDDMVVDNIPASETGGIYQDGDDSKKIIISPDLDYEISFFVKVDNLSTPITFELKGYDNVGGHINLESVKSGASSNSFFIRKTLKIVDQFYWVRGILYNQNKSTDGNDYIFPEGNNLRSTANLKYIVPNILLDNSLGGGVSGSMNLTNIKIRPLNTPFTRGQLGLNNIILSYLINNNSEYNVTKIEDITKNSLINATNFLKINYI